MLVSMGEFYTAFPVAGKMAKQCLKMGFFISFAGPLTYKNARVPVEVAGVKSLWTWF